MHVYFSLKFYLYAFAVIFTALLIIGSIYGLRTLFLDAPDNLHASSIHAATHSSQCGNSSSEARVSGCKFNQLLWAWYPSKCPQYANSDFIQAEPQQPWRYYNSLDHGRAVLASDNDFFEVLDSGVQLWGERREHLSHCAYMLQSAGQIIWEGGDFVPEQMSKHHFDHCTVILLDTLRKDKAWYDIETTVPRPSFGSC